ncbi:MAG: TOBE domain-containing protein, partial [Thermoplasmata archaeon]|nr:TOBE domain-containing protein [Thermoplasmata archaeon]
LVLLDEPFAAVDPEIRSEMRGVFRAALRKLGVAAIHVTHDREEGLLLADRVLLLLDGRIEQVGSPSEVFEAPGSASVARFLGYNVVREGFDSVAVHPSQVTADNVPPGLAGEVEASGIVGIDASVIVRLNSGERVEARGPPGGNRPKVGASVFVRWERSLRLGTG